MQSTLAIFKWPVNVSGKSDFLSMRDYLIAKLIIDNASRPGAISNLTLKEFDNAHERENGMVIEVFRHKTDCQGPAALFVSTILFKRMEQYLRWRNTLPDIGKNDSDTFFVSWTGGRMSSNMVGTQFTEFFSKCTGLRINATIMRKFVTTTIHKHHPSLKEKTAELLCHNVRTASKSYALIQRRDDTAETSAAIQNIIREDISSSSSTLSRSRDDIIERLFKEHITKQVVNINIIRQMIEDNSELSIFKEKQLLDRVRYLIRKRSSSIPENAENQIVEEGKVEVESEFTEDSTEEKAQLVVEPLKPIISERKKPHNQEKFQVDAPKRKWYTSNDNANVRKHLKQFIESKEPIVKAELESYIKDCPQLKELVESKGVSHCL